MEDLQLNISIPQKSIGKKSNKPKDNGSSDYKFVPKPTVGGSTFARKRTNTGRIQVASTLNVSNKRQNSVSVSNNEAVTPAKIKKQSSAISKEDNFAECLKDLSENKGKFKDKNYQDLNDDIIVKQKPRSGGWISSLFKNNPDVPHLGQRAVKPLVSKVFAGKTFSDLNIHPHSVANLEQNIGLKELMTVQQMAIPVILQGRDVLIRSQTGSGKTIAYALPIVEGLQEIRPKINRNDGLKVIVVVPTRELAVQTYELFVKLVKPFTWIVPGLLSGGQKRKAEKARLRKGLSILVGTPGRINDHLRHTQSLNFSKTRCLVLDEADRLLDMGYEKDVAAIVKAIEEHKKASTYDPMALVKQSMSKPPNENSADEGEKDEPCDDSKDVDESSESKTEHKHNLTDVFLSKERQTILLSATLTKAVENLAGITMADPVFVDTSEGRAVVADSLKTHVNTNIGVNVAEEKSQPSEEKSKANKTTSKSKTDNDTVTKDNIDEKKPKEETRLGLKQFNGLMNRDLFDKTDNVVETKSKQTPTVKSEDSDSDSDYEYFKVQNEIDKKTKTETEIEEPEANTFNDALKQAITEDELILPASVNQTFLIIPMKLRLVTLCSLIIEHCVTNKKSGKMIVFMATLEMVDYHAELIEAVLTGKDVKVKKKSGKKENEKKEKSDDSDSEFEVDYQLAPESGLVPVELEMFKLHGSMPHEQRMEVFKQFRKAKRGVLVCTDVAARGIDVPKVDLVLQYCAPTSATDYVHRVGRTGRAAQVGAAIMFLLPSESEFVRYLEAKRIRLRQSDEQRSLEPLRDIAPNAANAHRAAITVQTKLEQVAHSNKEWLARASRAYTSWVRFYSGYPRDVREYLDPRNLHLGHAAKAFALRDTPGALAKRAKNDPDFNKEKPTNKLTVRDDEEKKRPGFAKLKVGSLAGKNVNKQSSMHTASEFDSGLPSLDQYKKKKKKK